VDEDNCLIESLEILYHSVKVIWILFYHDGGVAGRVAGVN
jgi:hypothetical protein